ncbi:MAG TPA: membrane protein insertase YidC [Thermoanaerobaculia bacterium]
MEKRLLLAAGLSLAVLVVGEILMPKPPKPVPGRPDAATSTSNSTSTTATSPSASSETAASSGAPAVEAGRPAVAPVAASDETATTLENGVLRLTITNRGAVVSSAVLPRYLDEQKRPLELVRQLPAAAPRPLALDFPGRKDATDLVSGALFSVEKVSGRDARFTFSDGKIEVKKEIRLGTGYLFDVSVSVVGPPYALSVGTGLRNPTEKELANRYVMPATAIAATASGGIDKVRAEKLVKDKKELTWALPPKGFAGIEDNYFLAVLLPDRAADARVAPFATDPAGKTSPTLSAAIQGRGELAARAYFGPKDVEILESLHLGLERTVDFGWYGVLARPLLWLLKRTYGWIGNWGFAILLVTLAIRILLFPLMHKSYASMKKMQKLAPKMNAIKDKYKKAKTDAAQRNKMNQELMALYQAEGYNPMSGCLPILLQLPILVAFYNVLSRSIELRHAPFALWIKDLSAVDHTYVLLILMIVSMYVQQAMTPSTADPAQKRIFMAMPLLWGFFLKDMPSGLVLYWLFSNVLTILQQMLINKIVKDDEPPVAARAASRKPRLPQAKGAAR